MPCPEFEIRHYRTADRDDVLQLSERLTVGVADWLDCDAVANATRGWVAGSIEAIGNGGSVFVADAGGQHLLGFVSVARKSHFSGLEQAYVGELAVAGHAEGCGVGRALMHAVETWARQTGLQSITLETGAANVRAREFYRLLGYAEESVTLTRMLD